MSSWEEIADEIAPLGAPIKGLATGARRGEARPYPKEKDDEKCRVLRCPISPHGASFDQVLGGHSRDGHYVVARSPHEFDASYGGLEDGLQHALKTNKVAALHGLQTSDLLFADIETTGLSSDEPLFLIGTLSFDGTPKLELLLARSFGEERAVLSSFHKKMRGKTLVTFNGRSFDWPYIRGRSQKKSVLCGEPERHFDLLHHARRNWKSRVPNCRLQTLERFLCRREREGDISSSLIPNRYHQFLEHHEKSGNGAHLLAPILFHNALDVLTMAELLSLDA